MCYRRLNLTFKSKVWELFHTNFKFKKGIYMSLKNHFVLDVKEILEE
jgi:hypothetical protein